MDIFNAEKIIRYFMDIPCPTDEDRFQYIEALEYIIKTKNNPYAMLDLGSYYYENQEFDLALKYYELASANGAWEADPCLGYIWYYGRTGTVDYEKAFRYYSKGMLSGDMVSSYKVADMYKNGYFVEKDYEKYTEIIDKLFKKCESMNGNSSGPIAEIYLRYLEIHKNDRDTRFDIMFDARMMLVERLVKRDFFGDFSNMKWIIEMLNEGRPLDVYMIDMYDLYAVFRKPFKGLYTTEDNNRVVLDTHKVSFVFEGVKYYVEAFEEDDGSISVKFNDKWFKSVDDFMMNAKLGDYKLCHLCYELEDWKVVWRD